MRTFVTLEFDKKTKEYISGIQNLIRQKSMKGRFKYIDNFHLTLKFLGEADREQIDTIYDELLLKLAGQKGIQHQFMRNWVLWTWKNHKNCLYKNR
jgi:2'-5' RNA ligase